MHKKITQVPTNIITGFLGTGKTSTIQHLLKFKPEHERWAILVNEFGTVGIDGTHYQSKHKEEGGVYVREVPGGCMCCVSGLPMQIALNVLLKLSDPHRLLIEPSGLGHPVEVLSLLKSKYYKEVLDIQQVITLVDPNQFTQSKYFEHPTYQQQLEIADTLVVNKTDLCLPKILENFKGKLAAINGVTSAHIYSTQGQVDPDVMVGKNQPKLDHVVADSRSEASVEDDDIELPAIPAHTGYLISSRFDEGFHAISWRYFNSTIFDKTLLLNWLGSLKAERVKGVLVTDEGVVGINAVKGHTQIDAYDSCAESRLEIIASVVDAAWEESLNHCVKKKHEFPKINQLFSV